ncbi:myeloid cell surface antigen CD33-like [Anoplopoma fimbria]|uniref:myeloid cell surface antigen CD33-like n=1 Tax=Anoplopoma fimbria TaxID=229290 RepID=UPI0023EB3CEA|nr:myeloid cell surface antigen CD33-like [Anoplopoma fimbria]
MAVWDPKISWCFMLLLADVVSDRVNYPGPVCAVKGSTVTIPCTFTHPKSVSEGGREVSVQIIRVIWCQNHEICQGFTPSVYDSDLKYNHTNNPRYRYLGDKKGDCSLQITDVQKRDDKTLRFRMEAHTIFSPYTGPQGVKVTVTDGAQMEIRSSVNKTEMREGEAVTLNCTSGCSFHQPEVTWFRDGHALKHTGPSLYLGTPTAQDSGNYNCGLKNNNRTLSKPFSLYVEAEEEGLFL